MISSAVFWDIDGTLVDSDMLHREKLTAIAKDPLNHGCFNALLGVCITEQYWDELRGKGDIYVYHWLCNKNAAYPLSEEKFSQKCAAYYLKHTATLQARPGAMEAFNKFASAGLPQAAVSNGPRDQVDANLQVIGLKNRMVFSLSTNDVTKLKPDPQPYQIAHRNLLKSVGKVSEFLKDPASCIVIEDSATGVEAGKKAGMTVIYWKSAPEQEDSEYADYTVDSEKAFLSVVEQLIPTAPVRDMRS